MTVRVRMFAGLREAAGAGEDELPAGPLPELLAMLRRRHGDVFSQRLAVSSVLVDGTLRSHDDPRLVPDGADLALLPPVSGGDR